MFSLAQLSLKNRALIALVTVVASVFGVIAVSGLKQELLPSVQFPAVVVITNYPGASPEVVNNDVSEPIEKAIRTVPGLEQTTATSSTGSSFVLAEFTYGVDLASTEQKVERAISRVSTLLPADIDPQVTSGSFDDFPVVQIAVTPPTGGDIEETARLVDRVVIPKLNDIEGVREAQLQGALGVRVTIDTDPDQLAEEALTTQSITDALQQSGVLLPAGTITEDGQTLSVQVGSSIDSVEQIASLPLVRDAALLQARAATAAQNVSGALGASGANASGFQAPGAASAQAAPQTTPEELPVITIGEVATVELESNPRQSISRVNGEPSVTIAITKLSSANTVELSHLITDEIASLEPTLDGAQLKVIFDQAPYIEKSIETLAVEGVLGLVFAVLVILVFLFSVRATLVTAISIPVSVMFTFVGLNFAEYSLNLLTLGALTISIGRVVDDSIVVIENIKRHLEEMTDGENRLTVIVQAVREVGGAITASTITTVAVFLPLAFVSGAIGELFRPFAFTVTIALAASLLVALTIVPVLAYWFLREGTSQDAVVQAKRDAKAAAKAAAKGTILTAPVRGEERETALQRGYLPIVRWTLAKPVITLSLAVFVFAATIAATPLMKTNFLGSDEQNSIGLTQTLAPGLSLEEQLTQVERVEAELDDVPDVDIVQVTIGRAGGTAAFFGAGSDGVVSYSITTNPDASQELVQDNILEAVNSLDDAGEFAIAQSGGGGISSSTIEVIVTAPDQETLTKSSDIVVAKLSDLESLEQVESDLAVTRPYLAIVVNRDAAAEQGLSEVGVASQVSAQMQPRQIGAVTLSNSTVNIYLSQGSAPADREGVAALPIRTKNGEVRLDTLATIEIADGPVSITSLDGNRVVTVSAQPNSDDLGTAGADITTALDTISLPAGATASVGGVLSQQADAFSQLGLALLAAILIVYVVMVATFKSLLQPLLLLISVPFAATGALLLLIVSGIPLGVASLIGVLMLIGIVVTNAIVLIDLVNQKRAQGVALKEAVLSGSSLRLRPIVMTALATIFALTPMATGITGSGGFISQPLAVVVIGGLLSSTVLTLIVLPTLYFVVERARERSREKRERKRQAKIAAYAAAGASSVATAANAAAASAVAASASLGNSAQATAPLDVEPDGSATERD